ncbi:PREDICTED: heterogeneous nuclear ribonucleoprotein 1-like [Erythranthe guttata]|nr:PREDICTED: heterogeneous nuclear ribonucleoprotein 1-like [Erythranthe guttata]|eukprot:XP_012828555.1 PREDICTED: heterogeneous nuclear ribonucleoprotein 1-like [Erythranthe guttata]
MDSDQGKLFIGGISWETNEERLKEHFHGYGDVLQAVVMRDKITGKPRGFGFVVFADPSILDRVLEDSHVIDGRTVTLSEDGFRQYFESYGTVTDVVIMYDQQTNRPRGFGFISVDSEEAVDMVLHKTFHELSGKQVEVKRALPKDSNTGGGSGRSMGGGGSSGGYQGYGSSIGNSSAYDSRGESNRYTQSQTAGAGGYPSYGMSGYNAPAYGYGGPTNNGMGYGYGSYGGANPGYGIPNALNAQRNSWGPQAQSGYGYGSSQWGGAASGGIGGGAALAGQSPNQGYGYGGGYGGTDGGAYGNQAAYGAVGGRAANGAGHSDGGYGDGSGNSGYGNSGWRSDPSQASGNSYGGGYGGAST